MGFNTTVLSNEQISAMSEMINSGDYAGFYNYAATLVGATSGADSRIADFLKTAASINANDGSLISDFVRHAVQDAGDEKGVNITSDDFQNSSNALARTIFNDFKKNGVIPDYNSILEYDVSNMKDSLGLGREDWPGTLSGWATLGLDADFYGKLYDDLKSRDAGLAAMLLDVLEDNVQAGAETGFEHPELWLNNLLEILFPVAFPLSQAMGVDVNILYQQAFNFVRPIDPLALDLDGDGIETIGANGTVLFDHDGDGVKHGTGWVGKDDALLVHDLNGNGSIDTGAELFGTNSQLTDGTFAANGHQALADLDSNADGVIDVNDAAFASLQVWQDANQDGISQTSELRTLVDAGIASINTTATAVNTALGNGNTQLTDGAYTKTDGTTGAAGSLAFEQNNFYREFSDTLEVPEGIAALPKMQGSGAVRDLQQAA